MRLHCFADFGEQSASKQCQDFVFLFLEGGGGGVLHSGVAIVVTNILVAYRKHMIEIH